MTWERSQIDLDTTYTTDEIIAVLDTTYTLSEAAKTLGCAIADVKRAAARDGRVNAARLRQRYRWRQWRRGFQTPKSARLGLESKRLEDAGQQRLFAADEAEGE